MWILTREINEYNQDGAYFVFAFQNKPTIQELKDVLKIENDTTIEWIMQGGGRQCLEDEWYYLFEMDYTDKRDEVVK